MSKASIFRIGILVLVLLNALDINIFFHHYGKQFTDSDQMIFWAQAKDVSEGIFHSLFLYGQNYNIPLESFLAAPLIKMGVPLHKALILVNLLLIFSCFALLSFLSYKKGSEIGALISLAIPLIMPVEWMILTSSARGFIGGVVFAVYGLFFISQQGTARQILGIFLMFVGYTISPNAMVLIIPSILHFIINDKAWLKVFAYSSIPIIIWYGIIIYAKSGLEHVVHQSWKIAWTSEAFLHCITHFNELFKGVLPILYELGALIVIYLVAFLIWSFRKERSIFYVVIVFTLFILISLGINKVADGTHSIYFPYSRMFIALPLVFLWFTIILTKGGIKKKHVIIGSLIIIFGFGLKQIFFSDRVGRALKTNSGVVQVRYVPDLIDQCRSIDSTFRSSDKDVLVFHYKADELSFGCAIFCNTPTLHPPYERRTWLMQDYANTKVNNVLFYDWTTKIKGEKPLLSLEEVEANSEPFYYSEKTEFQLKDVYPQAFNFVE